jgi:hypothetical protein
MDNLTNFVLLNTLFNMDAVYRIIDGMLTKSKFRTFFEQNIQTANSMRYVTVYITDKEYNHFVELAKTCIT